MMSLRGNVEEKRYNEVGARSKDQRRPVHDQDEPALTVVDNALASKYNSEIRQPGIRIPLFGKGL